MSFKNKIRKNIKTLAVYLYVIVFLGFGAHFSFAAPTDPLGLSANGFELQGQGDKWTEEINPIDGDSVTISHDFVTTQAPQGTTYSFADPGVDSNIAYSVRSTTLQTNGAYAISTGKLDSGYSYTVIYDRGKKESATEDDFIREIRVRDPDGKESVYVYTAENKAGTVNKNGVSDKEILTSIGKSSGDIDLYEKIVSQDSATHTQDTINAINNTTLSDTQKSFLIDKVKTGTPLTDSEKASYSSLINYTGNIALDSSNKITTTRELSAVAAAASERDEALKIAEQNGSGVFLKNKNDGQCFSVGILSQPHFFIDIFNCISQIFYYLLMIATMALSLVGAAFNEVFDITVVNMKNFVDSVGIINVGWVAIRDMSNILFIFMLLYLAIATILQLDEHGVKHGLSRLIVGAVLINFSLFFVKIPIDISNILAIEIYDKINPLDGSGFKMGDAILSSLNFQNVYGAQTSSSSWGSDTIEAAQAFAQTNAPTTTFIMAMIMIAAIIFIFIAVIIIFIKRLVTLMMLMIFSPLAFAGIAIPNHSISHEIDSKFWGTLLRESFFAPVFMFIMYLGLMILNSDGFKVSVFGLGGSNGGSSFFGGVISTGTIINYVVVIFIFIFALTVSEVMGVKGAEGAIKAFDGMRGYASGWVGRNTIGRIANSTLQKGNSAEWLRKAAAGQVGGNMLTRFAAQQFARGAIKTTSSLAANKFGSDESYDDKVHNREEEFKAMLDELHDDPEAIAQILKGGANDILDKYGTDRKAADRLFHHLSGEQKLSVKKYMEEDTSDKGKKALDRFFTGGHGNGRLTPEEALDLEKMSREKISTYDKRRFTEEAFGDAHGLGKNITEAIKRFNAFTDKQRVDILSGLSADQQNELTTNAEFAKEMKLSLKNFDLLERVGKGPANTDNMKKLLSKIAYQKKARIMTLEALEKLKDGPEKTAVEKIFEREIQEMNKDLDDKLKIIGKDTAELIANYKKSEFYNEDLTFGKTGADKNLTRFISQSDEYKDTIAEITKIAGADIFGK